MLVVLKVVSAFRRAINSKNRAVYFIVWCSDKVFGPRSRSDQENVEFFFVYYHGYVGPHAMEDKFWNVIWF